MVRKKKGKVENFGSPTWNVEEFDFRISSVLEKIKYDEWY